MKRSYWLLVSVVFLLVAAGFSVLALDFSGPKYTDPAKPIQAKVGQEFGLLLESNPTTGYQWQLAEQPDQDVATMVINEYLGAESDRLGAGGHELWIFQATGPGKTVIKLAYLRPWEKDKKPDKTVQYTVVVKDEALAPGARPSPVGAKADIAVEYCRPGAQD